MTTDAWCLKESEMGILQRTGFKHYCLSLSCRMLMSDLYFEVFVKYMDEMKNEIEMQFHM